jgi:hypothetical protein
VTIIAKYWFQRISPSKVEPFHPIKIPLDAPIEGTKENLEKCYERLCGDVLVVHQRKCTLSKMEVLLVA